LITRRPGKMGVWMTRKKEAGQALIAAVAALGIVLMGFAGLGIDVGYFRYEKRLQQTAADSAAIAGAAEIPFGTSGVQTAAKHDAAANGFTDSGTGGGCPGASGCISVTVNSPPTSGPHNGAAGYVEVLVADVQPTFFMRVLGVNTETVTARAVANGNANGGGCIYVLGTSSTAINLSGGARISAPGCGVTDDGGLSVNNGASMTAGSVGVVGTSSVAPGSTVTPAPTTGIAPAANPLAYLTPPPVGSCIMQPGGTTLNPGTYCSLTLAAGGATYTLNPGVYVVTSNINISNGVTVNGSGVMFYQTAGTFVLGGLLGGVINLNLTPPTASNSTTGAVAGLLVWQSANDTSNSSASSPATIDNNTQNLTGGFYFPNGVVSIQGGTAVTNYSIFVAQGLIMANGTSLTTSSNYSTLTGGSPIKDALLVE